LPLLRNGQLSQIFNAHSISSRDGVLQIVIRVLAADESAVLGDAGVGKTSILNQFVNREFSLTFLPTVGADFTSRQMEIDGNFFTLQLWDTAGQERYRSLASSFFRGAEICVLVYDITSQTSFDSITVWYDIFRQQCSPLHPRFPFLLLGNKTDDERHRVVPIAIGQEFADSRGFLFFEVSAKMAERIPDALEAVVRASLEVSHVSEEIDSSTQVTFQEVNQQWPRKSAIAESSHPVNITCK
jgi:Ras-related protein Rab-7A